MVGSKKIYNKIISIDMLLDLDGMIPSLAELQVKLICFLQNFNDCLASEGYESDNIDTLYRAICIYLDEKISKHARNKDLSWEPYLLDNYFYGFEKDNFSVSEKLAMLVNSKNQYFFSLAYHTSLLFSTIPKYSEEINTILTSCSHRLPAPITKEVDTEETIISVFVQQKRINTPLILLSEIILLTALLIIAWFYFKDTLEKLI